MNPEYCKKLREMLPSKINDSSSRWSTLETILPMLTVGAIAGIFAQSLLVFILVGLLGSVLAQYFFPRIDDHLSETLSSIRVPDDHLERLISVLIEIKAFDLAKELLSLIEENTIDTQNFDRILLALESRIKDHCRKTLKSQLDKFVKEWSE